MRHLALPAVLALTLAAPAATLAAPNVVATFLPVHAIVFAIMAGVGTPALLIDTPVSPHTYALTPSKRQLLQDADLVIGIGPDMEAGIWEVIEAMQGRHLELSETVADRLIGSAEDDDEHEAEPQREDEAGHRLHLLHDPHIWLDTGIAAELADAVAARLSELDPANVGTYRANAAKFAVTLQIVNAEIATGLVGQPDRIAVNYHDAFGYFARQWHIRVDFVVPEPDMAPSVGKVAELRQHARAGEIACLMTEPQFQPDLLVELADDYGLRILEIDPEGALIAPGPDAYLTLMRRIGATFAACLDPRGNPPLAAAVRFN
ncbi:MAG: zinc ABC transporter substrate-binding protein [Cucumibacter sp.]